MMARKARKWRDVRAEAHASGLIDERRVADAQKAMTQAVRSYRLAEVRKAQQMTQAELASSLHVSQARVSKIERGELSRTELGTLQAYVNALGGKLTVVADFGDEQLRVS
jgi:predicted XRE-type DNA-binding protein